MNHRRKASPHEILVLVGTRKAQRGSVDEFANLRQSFQNEEFLGVLDNLKEEAQVRPNGRVDLGRREAFHSRLIRIPRLAVTHLDVGENVQKVVEPVA